ncbi:BnaA09g40830D [Brassica napus]|uniref:BnaA09g40830D protein n=1 Tax=Brassica napus TaxID=3708 RepID=A0A078FEX6_BRANA|nr:BnaA09g40830D [Brassica napus]
MAGAILWMLASVHAISMVLAQDGNHFVHYDFRKADLYVDGMASTKDGRLKLTNSSKRATGHAFHRTPISFVNSSFSFSAEFVFAIVPEERTSYGQGMAFVVFPSIVDLRYGASTSYLGIFNMTNDNKTENHILAIELDTNVSSQALEESDNHVGIDVNSIVSVESKDASYFDDTVGMNRSLVLASKQRIRIWIEYDGENRLLNVTLAPLETPKPRLPLLSRSIDLSKIFKEQMFFGFAGSTGWGKVVLHRDIKASNILLDENLNGKLGDFGLAIFYDRGATFEATRVVGTIGHMAPEVTSMGVANEATDVYAFGVLMLEVVCGRRPVEPERSPGQKILVEWVASCGRRGALLDSVDIKLAGNFEVDEAMLLLKLGMICSQIDPQRRPTMKDITEYLEQKKRIPHISFDTAEFGIPIVPLISDETVTAQGSALSFASFLYDTITVLFRGR